MTTAETLHLVFNATQIEDIKHAHIARLNAAIENKSTSHPHGLINPFDVYATDPAIQDLLFSAVERVELYDLGAASSILHAMENFRLKDQVFVARLAAKQEDVSKRIIAAAPAREKAAPVGAWGEPETLRLLELHLGNFHHREPPAEKLAEYTEQAIRAIDNAFLLHPAETLDELHESVKHSTFTNKHALMAKMYELMAKAFDAAKDKTVILKRIAMLNEHRETEKLEGSLNPRIHLERHLNTYAAQTPQAAYDLAMTWLARSDKNPGALSPVREVASVLLFNDALPVASIFEGQKLEKKMEIIPHASFGIAKAPVEIQQTYIASARACAEASAKPTEKLRAIRAAFGVDHNDTDAETLLSLCTNDSLPLFTDRRRMSDPYSRVCVLTDVINKADSVIARRAMTSWTEKLTSEIPAHAAKVAEEAEYQLRIGDAYLPADPVLGQDLRKECRALWKAALLALPAEKAFDAAYYCIGIISFDTAPAEIVRDVLPKMKQMTPEQFRVPFPAG